VALATTPVGGSPSAPWWRAIRAHARFLQQCVQHCLAVAAPSAAEADAAGGASSAVVRRAGRRRGWERELHSPPAVFSDMATSGGALLISSAPSAAPFASGAASADVAALVY